MNDWKRISNFVKFSTKGITPKYVEKSSVIVLNQKCIRNNRIDYSFSQFTDDKKQIAESKFVKLGDILVNSTGAGTAGRCAFVSEIPKNHRLITDSHILILRCESYCEAQCLNYLLFSFEKQLMQFMTGSSGQSELDKVILLNLKTKMSTNNIEQQKIATVLSALDAKIELNNQINAELEKMAKTIYDYWFVQFDFPDANGKPYKSSGGKMLWNEELKREIPYGWEVLQLSNKLTFEKGIEPGSAQYNEKKESINHIKFIRVGDIENYSSIFVDNSQKKYATVNEKDVLVTFDGSVGKVAFGFEGAYSGGLRKIYDKSGIIDSSLIYFIFKDERLIKTIHKYATGSILLHAGASINNLKISFNEKKYLEFQNIIKPFFYKMMINKKQNQTLSELRDWLLPMLMNGQVKVN